MVQFDAFWSVFCYNFIKIVKIFIFIKIKDIVLLRTIFKGTYWSILPRMFVYCVIWCVLDYIFWELFLKQIYFSACGRPFLYLWGAFFGFPPPPEQNFLRALMNIWWYCCALDKGMEAYAPPPKILIKLHVWSIYFIKFPHFLSIRGACTPEKLFLGDAI